MKKVLALLTLSISFSSFSTVMVGSVDCPSQFEGKVKEIIEPVGAQSAFSKQKVIFENLQTFKGSVDEQVQVDVLVNGPLKFERGEEYQVQLRDGKICSVEKSHL